MKKKTNSFEKLEEVYHCSNNQGLTFLKPNESTHGEKWVYAAKDLVMSALFLGTLGGDFTCQVGRDHETNLPFICERYENAFEERYRDVKGSIYILDGKNFKQDKTHWDEEVICESEVKIKEEIKINDAAKFLSQLANEKKLIIKFYPEKIAGIPEDDEDLVERAVMWYKDFGEKIISQIKKFHPQLLDRVRNKIEEQ